MREPSTAELEEIARVAWALEPPVSRRELLRSEAGTYLDGLLTRCARGRGALDVAIGEGLLAMAVGDRLMRPPSKSSSRSRKGRPASRCGASSRR